MSIKHEKSCMQDNSSGLLLWERSGDFWGRGDVPFRGCHDMLVPARSRATPVPEIGTFFSNAQWAPSPTHLCVLAPSALPPGWEISHWVTAHRLYWFSNLRPLVMRC